jgi:hypothetical protein
MCSYFMDGESTIEEAWLQVVSFFFWSNAGGQMVRAVLPLE